MLNNKIKSLSVFVLVAGATAFATPGSTQEGSPPIPGEAVPACMTGTLGNVPQVPERWRGRAYPIIVAASDVGFMESQGFTRVQCEASNANRLRRFLKYRDDICLIAETGNEAVQEQYRRAFGVRPAILCSSMELVAGLRDKPPRGTMPSFDFLTN